MAMWAHKKQFSVGPAMVETDLKRHCVMNCGAIYSIYGAWDESSNWIDDRSAGLSLDSSSNIPCTERWQHNRGKCYESVILHVENLRMKNFHSVV